MRRLQTRAIVSLLLGLLLQGVPVPSARAQSGPGAPAGAAAPASQQGDRVTELFNKGLAASQAGDWEGARAAFAEALSLEPGHYQIAATLGRAEFMLGKHRDAAEHLAFFLREAPANTTPQARERAQQMLDKALTRIGSVTVDVNVPGAEVFVDGRSVGRAPLKGPLYVEPGARTFGARKEGYESAHSSAQVPEGTAPTIRLELTKSGAKPNVPGLVEVGKPNKVVIIAGAAVAVAALGVGAVSTGIANSAASDRDATLPGKCQKAPTDCASDYQQAADRRLSFTQVAFGTFLGAGIVGVAVATYAFWPRSSSSAAQSQGGVAFMVGPKGGGAVLTMPW